MKKFYLFNATLVLVWLLFTTVGYAQQPGSDMYTAIDAGSLSASFSDTRNNDPVYGYGNDYGQPGDDIYYTFTLAVNKNIRKHQ